MSVILTIGAIILAAIAVIVICFATGIGFALISVLVDVCWFLLSGGGLLIIAVLIVVMVIRKKLKK